jgi:hypothetical protein
LIYAWHILWHAVPFIFMNNATNALEWSEIITRKRFETDFANKEWNMNKPVAHLRTGVHSGSISAKFNLESKKSVTPIEFTIVSLRKTNVHFPKKKLFFFIYSIMRSSWQ